jgi:pantoate--beta-alanine ligase
MSTDIITFYKVKEIQNYVDELHRQGKVVGLVPTMGYLHEGHLSLVDNAVELSDVTIVSIFVNPTQFAPDEDFEDYPRDTERDKALLKERGADVVFAPEADEIYPDNFQTYVDVEEITRKLEGEHRPTHFKGVTTIVSILFNSVKPDLAVFGQKDAQQAVVIKRMVSDLKFDIDIILAPIVREEDGLAMSSRNLYLSEKERKDALVLYKSLKKAEDLIKIGEEKTYNIVEEMRSIINSVNSSKLDYIDIVRADNFERVEELQKDHEYYVLIACKIGKTRLIDNLLIKA